MALVGPGRADAALMKMASDNGRGLAERGAVVVCGGLGGVMEAACRGASEAGGVTVGLLPTDDRRGANRWLTVSLPTGMGELRNGLIARACDALIAVGGEWGTLSEIALARKMGRPVVALRTWDLGRDDVEVAADPGDAVARAFVLASR